MSKSKRLAAIQERYRNEKKSEGNNYNSNFYAFWQMKPGEEAVIRFLPDSNEDNPNVFYIEKKHHELNINGDTKKIPCISMWGHKCPICDLSKKYYDADDKEMGKYYYFKRTNLARILVVKDPLAPADGQEENSEGKVCVTMLNYQIMKKIKTEIIYNFDPTEDGEPWDLKEGRNFIIRPIKDSSGYNDYSSASQFENKVKPIDIEDFDPEYEEIDLTTLLPNEISVDKVQAMLEAHLSGEDYDDDDDSDGDDSSDKPVKESKEASVKDDKPESLPSDDDDDDADSDNDDDDDEDEILKRIRNRKTK